MVSESKSEHRRNQLKRGWGKFDSLQKDGATLMVAGLAVSGLFIPLIKKEKPRHLAGCWNLPGGKVEKGESYSRAMAREMEEETGLASSGYDWKPYAVYEYRDAASHNLIYFMRAKFEKISLHRVCRTMETERVEVTDWRKAVWGGIRLVPNLKFLIPLGMDYTTHLDIPYFRDDRRAQLAQEKASEL